MQAARFSHCGKHEPLVPKRYNISPTTPGSATNHAWHLDFWQSSAVPLPFPDWSPRSSSPLNEIGDQESYRDVQDVSQCKYICLISILYEIYSSPTFLISIYQSLITNHRETIWHLSPGFIINVWQSSDLHSGAIVDLQGFHGHAADGKSWLKATKCEPQKSFSGNKDAATSLKDSKWWCFSRFFHNFKTFILYTSAKDSLDVSIQIAHEKCPFFFWPQLSPPTNTELFKVGKDLRCWSHGRFVYQLQYCLRMEETKKYDYLISIAKKNTANIPIPHGHSL